MERKRRRGHGEGSVYQLPDGRWRGAVDLGWQGGRRRRKYVTRPTRVDVAREVRSMVAAAEIGRLRPGRAPTVAEWMDLWLQDVASGTARSSTVARYDQEVRLYIKPHLGRRRIDKVRPEHITSFYREMGLSLRPASVRRLHAVLRRSFTVAMRWGVLSSNPVLLVDPPRVVNVEVRPLSRTEAGRLLKRSEETRLHARWVLGLIVGMRQGEVLGLAWEDVDLQAASLRVRRSLQRQPDGSLALVQPKTARSRRVVPLPPSVAAALRFHRARQLSERLAAGERWEESGLVFTTRAGRPIHPRNDYRSFQLLLQQAGLRRVRVHDLRHTAASLLKEEGADARTVMEILGHAQVDMTLNVYTHVAPEQARAALESVDAGLLEPSAAARDTLLESG